MESTRLDRDDIQDQALGNVEIIRKTELKPLEEPVVKYIVPPDLDIVGINTPRYDCVFQKVIDEMGIYIKDYKMQFVMGGDDRPRDIIQYFPKYVLNFRSGTVNGTPDGVIANLEAHTTFYHSLGLQVFYYLDDYLLSVNNRAPIRLMSNCDGIIVSTNTLKDAIMQENINRPIYLLKTHVALNTFAMLPPLTDLRSKDGFHILFTSQGRIGAMQLYRLVEEMDKHPDKYGKVHFFCLSHEVAQIRSIINKFRNVRKTYMEWVPLDVYYRLCSAMDLIIAPGEVGDLDYMLAREVQKPWLDAKSCHKYTIAGAAGIPCIASPMRDYEEAITHGENGFIAETDAQWLEYIELMMNNENLRKEIGMNAKKDIEAHWSLYDRTKEFASILRGEATSVNIKPEVIEIKSADEPFPPVLVYIPVHNYKKYIRECLDSVVSQTYPNQEIIVADNASDDGTREVIEQEYPMVKLIKYDTFHDRNPGFVEAVKMSKCKFLMQLGADDKLVPSYWETVLPFFTDPAIGFVRVGCYGFSEQKPEGTWIKPFPISVPKDLLVMNRTFISSPIRREAFDNIKMDNDCFFSDWDMWIQLGIEKGWRWATCKKPMFWYRRHSDSQSMNFDPTQSGSEYTYMRNKWMPHILQYGIKASVMASSVDIEVAKKSSKYAIEEIKNENVPILKPNKLGPKVLVYVPVYNSSKYIRECLDSVVSQTYSNQEIIVGNNCSTDDTMDIIQKEYPSVKVLQATVHNPKLNPLTNTAVEGSNCEFFITLGSDDKLCPDFWETLLPLFDAPDVGFVRIGAYQFGERNPSGTWWRPFAWHEPKDIFESNKVFQASPIRKEVWKSIGGIDINCVWGDWDFWMSAVVKGWKWRTYEKPMYWYRRHEYQASVQRGTYSKEEFDYLKTKWVPTFKKFGLKQSMIATEKEIQEWK